MDYINLSPELALLMRWYDEAGAEMRSAYNRGDHSRVSYYCKLQTAIVDLMHKFKQREENEQPLSSPV